MSDLRQPFETRTARLLDEAGDRSHTNSLWAPVIVTGAQIEELIRALAEPSRPNGRRSAKIIHPDAQPGCPGLAPGIEVRLNVLRPGEETAPFRHNATEVNFCIRGAGRQELSSQVTCYARYDVWNTPSYTSYRHRNTGEDLLVWLTYSNAPLLKFLQVYITEDALADPAGTGSTEEMLDGKRQSPFGTFEIGNGAMLMPYECLINPPAILSPALHWPWARVEQELLKLEALGSDYVGRRLYLMYNPMTGRTNGTTPSFFATITIRPPNIVDRPHRHVSAAINYYFRGRGRSAVAGNIYEWGPGDLMLSAPGWAVHNHASYDERVYELTIQDQPLNIVMESLLWQEEMKSPPALLGAQRGFETNRAPVEG